MHSMKSAGAAQRRGIETEQPSLITLFLGDCHAMWRPSRDKAGRRLRQLALAITRSERSISDPRSVTTMAIVPLGWPGPLIACRKITRRPALIPLPTHPPLLCGVTIRDYPIKSPWRSHRHRCGCKSVPDRRGQALRDPTRNHLICVNTPPPPVRKSSLKSCAPPRTSSEARSNKARQHATLQPTSTHFDQPY